MKEEVIEEIEKMHRLNPQYTRLGCLYDNRNKKRCITCFESGNGCMYMLRAFEYPPYD